MNIYDFKANTIDGKEISLDKYKGKVVLIVNTASKCGFTPQFKGLEELYQKYKDKGLVILGFPCNQFASQDAGTNDEISEFCSLNYGVTFQMFEKIDVNGDDKHPLYKYLQSGANGVKDGKIKWNFTKFLIDKSGEVQKRYGSNKKPVKLEKDIESFLR